MVTVSMATKRRRVVQSEGRSIIASVYHFLKEEYEFTKSTMEPDCDLSHLRNISQRTADATGVSVKTVERILKEEKELPSTSAKFPSPMKKRRKRDNKVEINNFTADVIRSTIQNFHVKHEEVPTLVKLTTVLNEKIGFDGCLETLRKLLLKLGYTWRKTESKRKVLAERHDVQILRLKFLKKMLEYRSQGRPIVYSGESNVLPTHVKTKLTLVHAGTKDGFIENASLVYKANSTLENNQSNMSYDDYVKWFNANLLPNLPARSVIVFDGAYYQMRAEELPTETSKKKEMQHWLKDKAIPFDQNANKVELYEILKKNKNDHIVYKIDEFIKSKGFDVLRLPPCHPELNAIENVWGIVKNYIASKKVEKNMTNAEELINQGLAQIGGETWFRICQHVEKIERNYLKYLDLEFDFVNVQDDSEDSDIEFECVSDSD